MTHNHPFSADALLLHTRDNVLLALADLPAGHVTRVGGEPLALPAPIRAGHKFARHALASGEIVIKYGQPVGRSIAAVAPGAHIHVHNAESLRGRGDLDVPLALPSASSQIAAVANATFASHQEDQADVGLSSLTFAGYRRRNGRAGTRNHVLVLSTVQCANGAVRQIGKLAPDAVTITHVYGCSQLGDDLAQTTRVLQGFATHPNVSAVLLVGLGCESLDTLALAEAAAASGATVRRLVLQEAGGTTATAERGAGIVQEFLAGAAHERRVEIPLSELILGLECGGSDAWSGLTANPALGLASDNLIAAGGTAILSEVPEFIGAEHLLAARASPELGAALREAVYRWESEARRMGVDLRGAQPTPGNIAGGLTTIEEKSLGAITKGGSSPVAEYIGYAYRPARPGLVIMDTPGNDPESVTAMVAGGAQLVAFTTGRGSPAGCPIAPVIKIATNTATAHAMPDDIDLNAGTIITGGEALASVGDRIFAEFLAVASGKLTAAERLEAGEFAINMIGPRL